MTGYVSIGVFGDCQFTNLCPVTFPQLLFLSEDQGCLPRKAAMNLLFASLYHAQRFVVGSLGNRLLLARATEFDRRFNRCHGDRSCRGLNHDQPAFGQCGVDIDRSGGFDRCAFGFCHIYGFDRSILDYRRCWCRNFNNRGSFLDHCGRLANRNDNFHHRFGRDNGFRLNCCRHHDDDRLLNCDGFDRCFNQGCRFGIRRDDCIFRLIATFATAASATTTTTTAALFLVSLGFRRFFGNRLNDKLIAHLGQLVFNHFRLLAFATLLALATRATLLALSVTSGRRRLLARSLFSIALVTVAAVFIALAAFATLFIALVAIATATAAIAVATSVATAFARLLGRGRLGNRFFRRLGRRAEPREDLRQQAAFRLRRRDHRSGFGLLRQIRGRLFRRNTLDGGLLARLRSLLLGGLLDRLFERHVDHLVRRFAAVVMVQIVMTQAGDRVCRRFEMNVRDQQDGDLVAQLDGLDVGALFVKQEGGDIDRNLDMHGTGIFLHRFLFEDAQDVQRRRFGRADVAGAGAARAGDVAGFGQCRTQALTGKFHQAEAADLAHLDAGTVEAQRIAQAVFDFALVLAVFHVDEVDHDQATQVAQAQLAGKFFCGFEVGLERGFLDVGTLGGAAGVYVDGNQRFGMIDDDGAAGRQVDLAGEGSFDLVLDLEAREQLHVVAVALDAIDVARHHRAHKGACLIKDLVGIDQDFADVRLEVIANGPNDQAAFEIDQEGAALLLGGTVDGGPQLQQIVQVPLQFFGLAANGGGAGDQAHAVGHFELIHDFAQIGALVTIDAAGNATATRIVRHQNQVAAGQRNVGGQRGALVAAFVLVDLDDQFLTFLQRFLDLGAADFGTGLEIGAGDFLERQEAVAIGTVIDEAGFEGRFDPGDDPLVDVALALFLGGGLNVEINQFLTIDNGDTEFFRLCRIEIGR